MHFSRLAVDPYDTILRQFAERTTKDFVVIPKPKSSGMPTDSRESQMVSKLMAVTGAVALLAAAPTWASVMIRTGNFDANTSYFDAFNYSLGPGAYHFTLSFSTAIKDIYPDSTVEKVTTTNYYCDFNDGNGEVYCGGDDVPAMPEFDQLTPTLYRIDLTVDPPYNEPPPSPPPYMRYDQFDTCCSITLDFDTLNAGSYVLSYTAAPEPETWSLMIVGLLGVGALSRYRRKPARWALRTAG